MTPASSIVKFIGFPATGSEITGASEDMQIRITEKDTGIKPIYKSVFTILS